MRHRYSGTRKSNAAVTILILPMRSIHDKNVFDRVLGIFASFKYYCWCNNSDTRRDYCTWTLLQE